MALPEDQLRSLLDRPGENLGVELKAWFDPRTDEGKAKIARGCMALRNNNGGHLLVGFGNDGTPDIANVPADVRQAFHSDAIQAIVGQFSSEPFPVEVQIAERDGAVHAVVISVLSGVRTPVAARRSLGPKDKPLIEDHAVYVRSLTANLTASSSKARRGDWDRLIQICLDNREADIGAFVRRHLAGINLERLGDLLTGVIRTPQPSAKDRARTTLDRGHDRFIAAMRARGVDVPQMGFREAAVAIEGEVTEQTATESFLQKLFVSQPQHTGWPAWVDSRRSTRHDDWPAVLDEGWETLLADFEVGPFRVPHLDFWRIDPEGDFYLLTALEDDMPLPAPRPQPLTQLDFQLQIRRVAEIISVALSFGRSMGCDPSKASLSFAFRWSRLNGRRLTSRVEPIRLAFHAPVPALQDEVITTVTVPLDTPRSAVAPHVEASVRNLFAVFGGSECPSQLVQKIVDDALQIRFGAQMR